MGAVMGRAALDPAGDGSRIADFERMVAVAFGSEDLREGISRLCEFVRELSGR